MKFTEEILELFEKHKRGMLSLDQEKALLDNLANDPELQEAFDLFKLADETSSLLVENELSEHLRSLNNEQEPVTRFFNWRLLIGGALILVLAGALIYFLKLKESTNVPVNFADIAYQKVDIELNRGSIHYTSDVAKLADCKIAYTLNRLGDAVTSCSSITDPALKDEANYILAHVYYEQGEYEKAIELFEVQTDVLIGHKHDQCEYNMMLAWYQLGNKEKSTEIMNRILASQNHYFINETKLFKRKAR